LITTSDNLPQERTKTMMDLVASAFERMDAEQFDDAMARAHNARLLWDLGIDAGEVNARLYGEHEGEGE
jgi:hypothetical protein